MQNIGINNLISICIGLFIILCCSLISYLFQKHLFSKYKDKVKNIISKDKNS
ncbi:MAG: hypothetical protein K0R54_1768 [Clostridiaceae bacterium]|jgi:hypothetical protein|nr:hypothetical protein [Clostridiaceae bacterium]